MSSEPPVRDENDGRIRQPWVIATIVALVLVIIGLLYVGFTADLGNQDRLSDTASAEGQPTNLERQCGAQSVHDAIKRELFRRAAQVRGSDQAAYEDIAGNAAARMEAAMMTSDDGDQGTISCSGLLWLDLPPGIVAAGGRRTLSGDVSYTIETTSEGAGDLVSLGSSDAIVSALAKLARVRSVEEEPVNMIDPALEVPGVIFPPDGEPAPPPAQPTEPEVSADAGPSFDCRFARTRSEIAVCNNVGLADLDRQMAGLYERSVAQADAAERELLARTRTRFLAYRDRCRNEACIAGAYQGRMREIQDIMAGRWQSPR